MLQPWLGIYGLFGHNHRLHLCCQIFLWVTSVQTQPPPQPSCQHLTTLESLKEKMGKDRLQHLVFNVWDLKYSFHFLNKNTLIKKVQNKCLVVAHLPLMNSLKTKVLLNAVQGILIHIYASSYSGTLNSIGLNTSINNKDGMLIRSQQTEYSTESLHEGKALRMPDIGACWNVPYSVLTLGCRGQCSWWPVT